MSRFRYKLHSTHRNKLKMMKSAIKKFISSFFMTKKKDNTLQNEIVNKILNKHFFSMHFRWYIVYFEFITHYHQSLCASIFDKSIHFYYRLSWNKRSEGHLTRATASACLVGNQYGLDNTGEKYEAAISNSRIRRLYRFDVNIFFVD